LIRLTISILIIIIFSGTITFCLEEEYIDFIVLGTDKAEVYTGGLSLTYGKVIPYDPRDLKISSYVNFKANNLSEYGLNIAGFDFTVDDNMKLNKKMTYFLPEVGDEVVTDVKFFKNQANQDVVYFTFTVSPNYVKISAFKDGEQGWEKTVNNASNWNTFCPNIDLTFRSSKTENSGNEMIFITWQSEAQDGSENGIYGRMWMELSLQMNSG